MNINLIEMLCPICQDKQDITQLYPANFSYEDFNINTFTARRIDYGCHYRIVKCKCGMVFSTPILSEEIINKFSISNLVYERVEDLIKENFVYQQDNSILLTKKGVILANIFCVYRRLYGLDLGQG